MVDEQAVISDVVSRVDGEEGMVELEDEIEDEKITLRRSFLDSGSNWSCRES